MAQKTEERKHFSDETMDVINIILGGNQELAERVLRSIRGYKPIPGINMSTAYMVSKISRGIKKKYVSMYAALVGIPHSVGKWESDTDGIISISKHLREAGIDCEPSAGMKLVGCNARNSRVYLYDPRSVLAIMYSSKTTRPRIEGKIRQVYGLDTVTTEPAPDPVTTDTIDYVSIFTPEFMNAFLKAFNAAMKK